MGTGNNSLPMNQVVRFCGLSQSSKYLSANKGFKMHLSILEPLLRFQGILNFGKMISCLKLDSLSALKP